MPKNIYLYIILLLSFAGLTSCAASNTIPAVDNAQIVAQSSTIMIPAETKQIKSIAESSHWQGDPNIIWDKFQHTSLAKLQTRLTQTTEQNNIAWLKLAIISKQASANTSELIKQLLAWRETYPNHPGNTLFPDNTKLMNTANQAHPSHIALLLPLQGPLATQGQAVRDGFLNAYYEMAAKQKPQPTISFYDTSKNSNISSIYQQAIADGANMIIGPLTKDNVLQLSSQNQYPIPTLALNYLDVNQAGPLPRNFFQFGLSQKDEAEQLAQKARRKGLSRALIIAPKDPWGQRTLKPLLDQWQSQGGAIIDSYFYTGGANFTDDIPHLLHINVKEDREQMADDNTKSILEQQRRQDFDVIFLLAQPREGRVIVPLLKYYYANNIPIYSTSTIYSGSPSPQKDADLNGVTFCELPWVLNKPSPAKTNRLYAVGRDAQLISQDLQRLLLLPYFPIYAATGALTMNSKQQIYRRVPWTEMHAGHPS